MTLTVSVMTVDETTGQFTGEILLPTGEDLAGPERWRNTVYASPLSVRLGLSLLCSLEHQDLVALGDDIVLLKKEVSALMGHFGEDEKVSHRLSNILRACDVAIGQRAAVWIA